MKIQKEKKISRGEGVGSGGGGDRLGWVQGGCEWRSEAFVKIQTFFFGGVGLGSGGIGLGGQGGWEQRSEACVKIKKKNRGGVGLGGQGGWERGIEAFVKIKKNIYIFFFGGGWVGSAGGASGWGVRIDVNLEVKLL